MHYYEVSPSKIVRKDSAVLTYHSELSLEPGALVTVPVGRLILVGVVIARTTKPSYETKPIASQIITTPLPAPLTKTAQWMARYYATHPALVWQTILPRGIAKKRRPLKRAPLELNRERTTIVFNKHQQYALDELSHATPGTYLLHGITGSGKTAVYIEHIKRTLESGKSAIVLVPEIALTSQLVAEFQQHFDDIILAHSRQTEAERHVAWNEALMSETPRVVIGPRSALFLPLRNIGVIIIDEAHEPSFKQDQSPRYSALRVASVLARHHGAHVIQGSATPLVSEYYLATSQCRPILELPEKAKSSATTPDVTVIDMTKKHNFTAHRFFSDAMLSSIQKTLNQGHQSLIFHNRRGSASTTLCESCGWAAICPRCFVPFTLHADHFELRCHICDKRERVPTSCPECGSTEIIHKGIGTKLIESELKKRFPSATIARFDGDTATADALDQRYQELYDGSIDIIVGTQVIAKGLDLPHLRHVSVVQADAGLALPDFMASERTFQLLAQVIGRVGRSSHPTSVVVQSYQPDASAVRYGISQDYAAFYHETIDIRKKTFFPPFTYLLKLTCVYKTERTTISHAQNLAAVLRSRHPRVTIFGPTPAFYERQRDTYRWQIVVKSTDRQTLLDIIAHDLPSAHWQYDIDPMTLL